MPKVSSISKTMTARSRDFDFQVRQLCIERDFLFGIAHILAQDCDNLLGYIVHGRLRRAISSRRRLRRLPHSFNQGVANAIAANLPQVQQDPPKINTFVQREGEGKTRTVVESRNAGLKKREAK